jgi:hypothetical protein
MKQSLSEIRQLQKMAGILGTKVKPGVIRENEYNDLKEESEYNAMSNDELISVLQDIYDVYSKPENQDEPAFIEAANHIKAAIDAIGQRSGD